LRELRCGDTPTVVDLKITTDGPARFRQILSHGFGAALDKRIVLAEKIKPADALHRARRLCVQRNRPTSGRASNSFDKIASSHCLAHGL